MYKSIEKNIYWLQHDVKFASYIHIYSKIGEKEGTFYGVSSLFLKLPRWVFTNFKGDIIVATSIFSTQLL